MILCGQENNNTTTNAQADERSNGEKYPLNKSDENSTINAVDTKTSNFNDLLPFSLHQIKLKHMQNPLLFIKIILENSIFSPDEIHCTFKPFRVYVEDKFIAVLIDFMIENLPANIIYAANASKERVVCESGQIILPRVITEQILILVSEPVRIRYISIKPLSVLLSVHTCMRYVLIEFMLTSFFTNIILLFLNPNTECTSLWITAHFILRNLKVKMYTLQRCDWVTILECTMCQVPYLELDGLLGH